MSEISLKIKSEIGVNRYAIAAYWHAMHIGTLAGYLDCRSGVIKIYPGGRLVPGILSNDDFPLMRRFDDLSWE